MRLEDLCAAMAAQECGYANIIIPTTLLSKCHKPRQSTMAPAVRPANESVMPRMATMIGDEVEIVIRRKRGPKRFEKIVEKVDHLLHAV